MTFVVIGGLLFVVGLVMAQGIAGPGTKWRQVRMRFYDRRLPDEYDKTTRRSRLYYRVVMIFGLVLFFGGLISLA